LTEKIARNNYSKST